MKFVNLILASCLLLMTLASCDKESIEPEKPVTPEPDKPTVVEIKEESLYGKWTLTREDNYMKITTSFEMKEDNTCVYTQTITDGYLDEIEEVNRITLNGKWSFNKENSVLTFNLNDEDGNAALMFDCTLSTSGTSVQSFKIKDTFSEKDEYCFKK